MKRLFLAVAALITGLLIAGTIDREEALFTEQRIREANERRVVVHVPLAEHPLGATWVLQSGNDGFGNQIVNPQPRHSMAADLTQRRK